jgi:hypothetical protein
VGGRWKPRHHAAKDGVAGLGRHFGDLGEVAHPRQLLAEVSHLLGVSHEVPGRGLADFDVGEVEHGAEGRPASPGRDGGGELAVGLLRVGHLEATLDLADGGRGGVDVIEAVIEVAATMLTEAIVERLALLRGHLFGRVGHPRCPLGLEDEARQQAGQLGRFEPSKTPDVMDSAIKRSHSW